MKDFLVKRLTFFLLMFSCATVFANEYPVTSYIGIEQGLSNNSVRCIYQDQKGLVWFGTYDGLNRFDGYSFKVFRNNYKNQSSLINNWINAIDEDAAGNLWVGTRQGACIYRYITDVFTPVYVVSKQKKTPEKIASVIRSIESDDNGNMFIGTADRGLIYIPKGDTVGMQIPIENVGQQGGSEDVGVIKKGTNKRMWVFIRDKGLCLFNYKLKTLQIVNSSVLTANCLETKSDMLWVGTSNGIYEYNTRSNIYQKIYDQRNGLSSQDIVAVTVDKNNKLWCATYGNGVTILDVENGEATHLKADRERNSLSSNSVHAIMEDKDERIWIGSLRGGINIVDHNKKKFQTVVSDPMTSNTLISNYVLSFYEEMNGKLWIGTDGEGLSTWDRTLNKFINYKHNAGDPRSLSNDFVTNIKGDHENNIWIATYRGDLNRYDRSSGNFEHYKYMIDVTSKPVVNHFTYSLLEDKDRNMWAGSLQFGLFKLNRETKAFELFDGRIKDLFVLANDKAGRMWGGNLSHLVLIDRHDKKHRYFFIGKPVRSILEDDAGNFWIGTEGGGLVLFDRKRENIIARYTTDEGLCSNSVLNILQNNKDELWVSTFNGISRFNPGNKTFMNYYQSDGLQSNQFNYNAALKLRTGELAFGGIKGFTLFNPANITSSKKTPKVLFTDIKVNNTPLEKESSFITKVTGNKIDVIKVPFNKAVLSFEFAALEFSAPDKIKYAYFLEGWDRGWNFSNTTRSANYTHLTEGTYTLRVKSTNAVGVWSNQELKLKIIVTPPWYRSWWAYLFYITLLSGIIYSYVKYRSRQTRLKYEIEIANLNAENERAEKQKGLIELEKEKIEREKREAELALEKAELEKERSEREKEHAERETERLLNEQEREINEKKISFFTHVSHEFRAPLTLIINPIKDLLKKKGEEQTKPDSELGIVYRNARRMLSLVDQLLLFRKAESGLDRLDPSKLNLYKLSWEVYLCFIQLAKSKNINYSFQCENQNLEIYADREKLEIILFNLLSNALKYTAANGTISFAVCEKAENVVIEVKDNGSGIPKETGEKLFDKFYKAERSLTSSQTGFGIGLFLVKKFTEQHKGVISYDSEEGQGATFILSLLKGKEHFDKETIVAEHESGPVFLEELRDELAVETKATVEEKLPSDEIVSEKQTILIVDDDEQIRQYLAQMFTQSYIVEQAENGMQGLDAAKKYLPDLIISDVHMREMNGIELCRLIKENDSLNHIPVVLLTASTSDELKLKGVEGGADDYITKPFDKNLLQARVANLLKSRNNLQKYFYNEITLNKTNQRISPEYKAFLDQCIAIVEKHLEDDDFNVKKLLKEMGMSHSNLFRKVKSVSGTSVSVFIRFIRLRKAAEMFINSNHNVNETAVMVGINDIKYFREQFNKLFGMNPSEYIRRYRNTHGKQYTVDRESISPE
jgi:signal transduction histidine kinase/ligand-binding sensor domain-containing protein/DNA-binding response OmpR family regulator